MPKSDANKPNKKPKKPATQPSIGVGHDDWASMNPGMGPPKTEKSKSEKSAPKKR